MQNAIPRQSVCIRTLRHKVSEDDSQILTESEFVGCTKDMEYNYLIQNMLDGECAKAPSYIIGNVRAYRVDGTNAGTQYNHSRLLNLNKIVKRLVF